jgi:hypothetical protein
MESFLLLELNLVIFKEYRIKVNIINKYNIKVWDSEMKLLQELDF